MAHTWRRAALYNKRYAAAKLLVGRVAGGNLLVADNDEPEPDGPAPLDPYLDPLPLPSSDTPDGAPFESATEYAQRRARENDQRAFDLQINGSGVRPW